MIGLETLNPTFLTIIAILLLGTIEEIRAAATTLGEEIRWRVFSLMN